MIFSLIFLELKMYIVLYFFFSQIICHTMASVYTVYNMPSIPYDNTVQFYYLEAAFPSNTPQNIINAAGQAYNDYSTTHAGLGIWDVDGNTKFSIDFISLNYTGALFPDTSHGPSNFQWKNQATIQVTNPLVEDNWVNSRLIVATSGVAYQDFVDYLHDSIESFAVYQPITLTYVTAGQLANYTGKSLLGSVSLQPFNSYTAVDIWVNQLASFGCSVQAFLQVYSTAFYYLTSINYASTSESRRLSILLKDSYEAIEEQDESNSLSESNDVEVYFNTNQVQLRSMQVSNSEPSLEVDKYRLGIDPKQSMISFELESDDLINIPDTVNMNIPIISWTVESGVNLEVYEWYAKLQECYTVAFEAVSVNQLGATNYLDLVKHCYGKVAYIYLSPTSVYNVSLGNFNSSNKTPLLGRYVYNLPEVDLNTGIALNEVDYIVSALIIVIILFGIYYFVKKFCTKKQRRRVSFMGEQVATQAVKTLHEEEQYNRNSSYDYYYSPRNDSSSSINPSRTTSSVSNLNENKSNFSWMKKIFSFERLGNESPRKTDTRDSTNMLSNHDAGNHLFHSSLKLSSSMTSDRNNNNINNTTINNGTTRTSSGHYPPVPIIGIPSNFALPNKEEANSMKDESVVDTSQHSDNPLLTNTTTNHEDIK